MPDLVNKPVHSRNRARGKKKIDGGGEAAVPLVAGWKPLPRKSLGGTVGFFKASAFWMLFKVEYL
jgi:hypothetical protein